ncbi:MAG: ABC transporter permease [Actinomycetota bacterium]
MWRATVKALFAQRIRLVMTVLSVMFGVAFVAGTFVLTDTMSRSLDNLFRSVNEGIAVEVTAVPKFESQGPGGPFAGDFLPDSLLQAVRGVDGVQAAAGRRSGYVALLEETPAEGPAGPRPSFGFSWTEEPELNQFVVRSGRPPVREGEVVLIEEPGLGRQHQPGERVRLLLQSGVTDAEVVGIAGFSIPAPLQVTLVAFDPSTASKVFGADSIAAIAVAAAPGVSPDDLRDRIEEVLPPGVQARTGDEAAAALSDELREGLGFLNTGLLAFAGISIFVGAFIIFNTFQILVTQRSRELALLRALGATPGQVRRSVTTEALLVGIVASGLGIGGGVLLAVGMRALIAAFGAPLPGEGVVLQPRTVVIAAAVGIGITLIAALGPAAAAGRIPAIAALRQAEPPPWRISDDRVLLTVFLGCSGSALLVLGLDGYEPVLALVGGGAALVLLAVTAFAAIIVRPVSRLLGAPLSLGGVAAKLGRENAMRNPRRTALTAAALMIGLGLVGCVSIVAESWKASTAEAVEGSVRADYIASSTGFTGFSPEVAARLRAAPEFTSVVEFRRGTFGVGGRGQEVGATDPSALPAVLRLELRAGRAALGEGQVLVSRSRAEDEDLRIGSGVPAVFALTGAQRLEVAGIFEDLDLLPGFLVSLDTFDRNFTPQERLDSQVLMRVAPGANREAARAVVDAVAEEFPVVAIRDQAEFKANSQDQINQVLGFVTALLGLSVFVAGFGIANTLALSVFERTREIGLLRAVGMAPRQVRRMVRWESVIIAVLGALLGTGVGVFFGWALVRALAADGVSVLAFPTVRLGVAVGLAAVLGVVAAAVPAFRASRLRVLDAIAYE